MRKKALKKLLLSSLIALQLGNSNINTYHAYAKEASVEESQTIALEENGKKLQLISLIIDDYENTTFGYIFPKDGYTFFEDALTKRIYNMTVLGNSFSSSKLIYTDATNILPQDLEEAKSLTIEEAKDIISQTDIVNASAKLPNIDFTEYTDFIYQTYKIDYLENYEVPITNNSSYSDTEVTKKYDEEKEDLNFEDNEFKLGIFTPEHMQRCYTNIYQKEPFDINGKPGVITRYYVFDINGKHIKTLYTQDQIDEFIETNKDKLSNYTWKAALYTQDNIDDILTDIDNNKLISPNNTSYFIDYKTLVLTKKGN